MTTMKHVITELEIALDTARNNEPLHRAEGNIAQADLCAARIPELEEAIATLKFAGLVASTTEDVAAYLYSAFTCGASLPPVPWDDFVKAGNESRVAAWRHLAEAVRHVVRPGPTTFAQDLARVINCHSMEIGSHTPDHILAEFLTGCLKTWNEATRAREKWYASANSDFKEPGLTPAPE